MDPVYDVMEVVRLIVPDVLLFSLCILLFVLLALAETAGGERHAISLMHA